MAKKLIWQQMATNRSSKSTKCNPRGLASYVIWAYFLRTFAKVYLLIGQVYICFGKEKKSNLKNLNNLDYSTLESSDAIPSSIQFRQYLYVSSRVKLRAIYLQRSTVHSRFSDTFGLSENCH